MICNNVGCITLTLLVAGLAGCDSLEDPESVNENDIMRLHIDGPQEIQANGRDVTRIIARLPENAERLDIKFTTTKGIFVLSGSREINVFADSVEGGHRYAATDLRADTSKGIAYVRAEARDQRRYIAIEFE